MLKKSEFCTFLMLCRNFQKQLYSITVYYHTYIRKLQCLKIYTFYMYRSKDTVCYGCNYGK